MPERLKVDFNRGPTVRPQVANRLWNMGLALLVSLLVGFAVGEYVTHRVRNSVQRSVNAAATNASRQNCQAIAKGRVAGDRFRFAVREELSIIPASVAASQKKGLNRASRIFLAGQLAQLNADLATERRTIPGLPMHLAGYSDLFPLLADQPLISCSRQGVPHDVVR